MFLPSFQLQNKIAIVTGAGRGIGRALAIGLAEAGADVALFARTASDLESVAGEIRALGRQAYPFRVDVTSREQIDEAVKLLVEQTGRIDILINNAGMNIRSQALAVTDEEWDKIMQTNLKSAFLCSQIVGERMKEQGYGRIINIASVAGQVALRTGVVYAATKAAMIQMTKVLALEWGKFGIHVNGIGPWYFKTPLTETILANPDYLAEIIARTPLRRVGELEELVGPAVFLASDAANYITGQTLFVDGGMTIYGF
ncbi:SDR family NAD(P)-dependent oxidoreductase [Paenibacillus sp. GCM10023248]|uniref:SDR family NAD(P)-dependent oxidoreductase n=1 Tax=Bacillales TaxID=1385 RepID=UPI002379B106|nr:MULTISPECIES: glucose 1-dehydrogenase [Bacillales]MDD9267928.1 glucose 1-dehydrogenase [Paenibacillus sp. MAHUQ-63]MDR6882360.1 NAD(P)-dependent dehydrogenase (short-subunit alcohol dehydrogenase family) [Bacillus sp. 3255]